MTELSKLQLMSLQRVFLIAIICCTSWDSCQAQYRVIIAQGRSYINVENTFHQLEVGELLPDSVSIDLVDNAALTLLDKEGNFFVLNRDGTYELNKVSPNESTSSSEIIAKIWNDHFENIAVNQNTESVELERSESFELYLPSSSEAYGFELFLKWTAVPNGNYRIQLIDEYENLFTEINTAKSEYKLDLLSKKLAWKRQVFVRVMDLANELSTGLKAIAKLSPPDLDNANSILSLLPDGDDEVAVLTRAAFFEQRGWVADVHSLLFESSKKNEILMTYYTSFLKRNGFYSLIDEVHK